MGYMKKGGTVCNPAKKNNVVFQNSYTVSEQYQTGWWQWWSEQTGRYSWAVYQDYYNNSGVRVRRAYQYSTDSSPSLPYSTRYPTYGTRTVTRWNTKWSKLSA